MLITTQKDLRRARNLSFCYLCGSTFTPTDKVNKDHVPPSALFDPTDRDPPLILPTHKACNSAQSADDEIIGQLVSLLHGRQPKPGRNRLKIGFGKTQNGETLRALGGIDVRSVIRRWVRGFHAALYRQLLPPDPANFGTSPPLPGATLDGSQAIPLALPTAIPMFVKELKKNRAINKLDRVVCRNGQCRYECVWVESEDGRWFCIYGLDTYGWIDLGDPDHFAPRGCVGGYLLPDGSIPDKASRATMLIFETDNAEPLDPFGR